MKFQNNNTVTTATSEDFILAAFVIIEELYFRYVPDAVSPKRNVLNAKLSGSEIITTSICGELIGVDLEMHSFLLLKRITIIYFPELATEVILTEPGNLFLKYWDIIYVRPLIIC